ncbi:hypothetical protein NYO91_14205 [Arhodomonas aquaeolei]|uniref:hypothetical protein n=1 Tax=Arhodomonas aquaeolei TaxID=2369 RepID=UPI0021689C8D|nr:hypothetical protein [Arhodomonas aquaeolei]MCS4505233.1 hypothetical protein [Arhodomonas aquaeolei]
MVLVLMGVVVIGYWVSLKIRSAIVLAEGERFAVDVFQEMSDDGWSVDSIKRYSGRWLEYSSDVSPEEAREFFSSHGFVEKAGLLGDCDAVGVDLKGKNGTYVWVHCPVRVDFRDEYATFDVLVIWDGGLDRWFLYWIRSVEFHARRVE